MPSLWALLLTFYTTITNLIFILCDKPLNSIGCYWFDRRHFSRQLLRCACVEFFAIQINSKAGKNKSFPFLVESTDGS